MESVSVTQLRNLCVRELSKSSLKLEKLMCGSRMAIHLGHLSPGLRNYPQWTPRAFGTACLLINAFTCEPIIFPSRKKLNRGNI